MYHSLHTVVERKYARGLYYQLGWTWVKNLTDVASENNPGGVPQNSYDRAADRGNVLYMPRHRVVAQAILPLPFGRGRRWLQGGVAGAVLGEWRFSTNMAFETGKWFNPTYAGFDVSNSNTTNGRPDRIGGGALPAGERTRDRWFDKSAFRVPGDLDGDNRPDVVVGRFGNSGVGILEGPGRVQINASVYRDFLIREGVRLNVQFTVTNLPNRVNYGQPNANITGGAQTGTINSAGPARSGQIAARLQF